MKIVLSVIEKKLIHQLYSKYNMTVLIQKREMVDTTSFKMTIYNFSSSFFESPVENRISSREKLRSSILLAISNLAFSSP